MFQNGRGQGPSSIGMETGAFSSELPHALLPMAPDGAQDFVFCCEDLPPCALLCPHSSNVS